MSMQLPIYPVVIDCHSYCQEFIIKEERYLYLLYYELLLLSIQVSPSINSVYVKFGKSGHFTVQVLCSRFLFHCHIKIWNYHLHRHKLFVFSRCHSNKAIHAYTNKVSHMFKIYQVIKYLYSAYCSSTFFMIKLFT